jgi:16S rRNA (guanine(966)-N(2))-methyltransferase RsmD
VRVIAGTMKGRRLVAPRGSITRPTADQVRIALMDTLTPWLPDAWFLDLFAGAGGVGVEALSRGARHATFVERDPRAFAALQANVRTLDLVDAARCLRLDVDRALSRLAGEGQRFSIVFLDPPYDPDLVTPTVTRLGDATVLVPGALVIAQHFTKRAPPEIAGALRGFRARRFGETTLTFFRAAG